MPDPPTLTPDLRSGLQRALTAAFDQQGLLQFATMRLAFDDVTFADEVDFRQPKARIAFDLVETALQRNRVAELALALQQERPRRPDVVQIVTALGLAPAVRTESAGVAPSSPGAAADDSAGLEKTVKARLPSFDIAVWREKLTRVEGRICQVEIGGNPAGTGFLVGPAAVLTNHHVLASVLGGSTPPGQVACLFDYKVLPDGTRMRATRVGLDPAGWDLDSSPPSPDENTRTPDRTLPTTDQLDYALVRLERPIGDEPALSQVGDQAPRRGWVTIPATPPVFLPKAPLLIAQHPDGKPLKLSVDTEAVIGVNANRTRVRYTNNTEPGSSGSPVFDMDWTLVALHHLGDPAYDHPPSYNQGVVIDLVRRRIESRGRGDVLGS